MVTTRLHTCTYFDDGDLELLCPCGARGFVLVEDDDTEGMLVALLDDAPAPARSAGASSVTRDSYAISA
ncbi:hypothetical protein [Cellulomonas sp. ATA003]|uniref:hypothetical protein n=1 Tax=Cellulomonas sp. ATA003 TaxID=3073064 RepID=UPI0028738B6C|nr:hypothetical protein [Cellulomonas sp. ATA003]WNB86259.1 hypothetical protein REH70_03055 [Cellulomonas sp. ATA003]